VKGFWRREGYDGRAWQVSGGRGWPVVPGLRGDGYPGNRAEDIKKRSAEAGSCKQDGGALGGLISAIRLRKRFWWAGWYAAVEKQVADFLACRLSTMNWSRSQAQMKVWHPKARLETIAVDVLEISLTSATGMKKVVLIDDVFSRFMMAIAVPAGTAAAIAEVLFQRWIAVFGPPVRLLSNRGKVFVSEVVQNLCARVGTKKIFTSPYDPQTDGMVEPFNAMLCRDLAKFVTHEEDGDRHLAFAVFTTMLAVTRQLVYHRFVLYSA
jgi:Integrase core domain